MLIGGDKEPVPPVVEELEQVERDLLVASQELNDLAARSRVLRDRARALEIRRDELRARRDVELPLVDVPEPEPEPLGSAEEHFARAVQHAKGVAQEQNSDRAVLQLMTDLRSHPGTANILNSDLQGALMVASMRDGTPGVIDFLSKLAGHTRLDTTDSGSYASGVDHD